MSGGALEYVMVYTTKASTVGGSSDITTIYSDFYTNSAYEKYYDKYSSTSYLNYNNRILGDATGEMGPFMSKIDPDTYSHYRSSWYDDYAYFLDSSSPWFVRGGDWTVGSQTGSFAFDHYPGSAHTHVSFRVCLAPTN